MLEHFSREHIQTYSNKFCVLFLGNFCVLSHDRQCRGVRRRMLERPAGSKTASQRSNWFDAGTVIVSIVSVLTPIPCQRSVTRQIIIIHTLNSGAGPQAPATRNQYHSGNTTVSACRGIVFNKSFQAQHSNDMVYFLDLLNSL